MSPKSLLRHKEAISTLEDLAEGSFQCVLPEIDDVKASKITRAIFCSGKVYYDLLERRRQEELENVAIVRIEQLYPFPEEDLYQALAKYKNLKETFWCQEEPMNQGAWYSSQHHMRRVVHRLDPKLFLDYAGREASASPAAGYMALHLEQQEQLIKDALGL